MSLKDLQNKIDTKEKENKRFKVFTAKEIVKPFFEKIDRSTGAPLQFGFKTFDDLFDGDMRGQLAAFIGYGGTKKSLFALNMVNSNANTENTKSLYSTMEMPKERLFTRMIDYSFDPYYDESKMKSYRGSSYIKYQYKKDKGNIVENVENMIDDYYGKRLLISDTTRMTIDDYRKLLDEHKPDILVVDGLSRMGGQGSETEMYSNNSGDLKDLVNEYNVLGILICHCSKGATKTTRDLSRFVRGSEKILDNCDFVISFSLCEKDNGYDEKYGWMRLEDKRNTGKIIDQIYEFDELRLTMSDCNLEPKSFESFKEDKY